MTAAEEERLQRWIRRAFALAFTLGLPVLPATPAPLTSCPDAGTKSGIVVKVDDALDMTLKDGSSLHLAGLDPPRPTPGNEALAVQARDGLVARLGDGAITYVPLAPKPDRWGRIPAFAFFGSRAADQAAPVANFAVSPSVALFLLMHGYARFMAQPEAHACRAAFLSAEAQARHAKLGLWRDPYYAILSPADRAAFPARAASNVIVEARLTGVTSNRYRMSLEFAPPHEGALKVTILQRNVAIFDRSGLDFHALIGRTLRVRGLLDLRFGPHIEIANADDIELVTNEQRQKGEAGSGEDHAAVPPSRHP